MLGPEMVANPDYLLSSLFQNRNLGELAYPEDRKGVPVEAYNVLVF